MLTRTRWGYHLMTRPGDTDRKGRMVSMKSFLAGLAILIAGFVFTPPAHAQKHVEVGVFADYFRLSEKPKNFWGLGGRGAVTLGPNAQFEAELAYDFEQSFGEAFTSPTTGTVSFNRSNVRIFHGFFGPEFHSPGERPIVGFATIKGGFINFNFDDRPATLGTFFGNFDDFL